MDDAMNSSFKRRILNFVLGRAIPFNAPHHFKVEEIFTDGVRISLPYKRVNKNHLNGIHACALATLSEYASGLTLMRILRSADYRIIMKDLKMTYHYQAKEGVKVEMRVNEKAVSDLILKPLEKTDAVFFPMIAEVYDFSGNHISTGEINWQLKKWDKVKTKA